MSDNNSKIILGQYKGLKVPAIDLSVPQSEVDEVVESERQRLAVIMDIETPAVKGNIVNIDFDAFMDGKKLVKESDRHIDVELGLGNFLPELENALMGTVAGDQRELSIVMNGPHIAPEYSGKELTFKVTVNEVLSKTYPTFTPAFLLKNYGTEDYEEFLEAIREGVRERRLVEGREKLKDQVIDMILNNSTLDFDDNMLKLAVFEEKTEYIKQLESQGINFDEYVEKYGIDTSIMENQWKKAAAKSVGRDLVLKEIASRENLIATEDEVEERINQMAIKYKIAPLLVRQALENGRMDELKDEIASAKAVDLVMDNLIFE